jgi:hypothetical protein
MAFIRPIQKQAKPFVAVNLKNQAEPKILDELIGVSRLGKVASHVSSALFSRISAVVQKPRKFYIPQTTGEGMENLGCPVFTMDGKLVGVKLLRVMESAGGAGMMAMLGGAGGMGITGIILPASEILEASKQAESAKPEEKKSEEKLE